MLCRTNFPGFLTLPGEGQVPTLGFTWEHYQAAQAPLEEIIDGVLCHTRAEMVIKSFWVNYPFTESQLTIYVIIVLIGVFTFDCRPSIGVRMDMRRRRPRFSRPSVGGYYRTYAKRLGRRLFETTTHAWY